jgi:hypothetical protein
MEKCGRARPPTHGNIIWRVRSACWTTMATDTHTHTHTHTEYVIFIAFPRQQWSRERAAMKRYMYTACIFLFIGADYVTRHLVCLVGT